MVEQPASANTEPASNAALVRDVHRGASGIVSGTVSVRQKDAASGAPFAVIFVGNRNAFGRVTGVILEAGQVRVKDGVAESRPGSAIAAACAVKVV